MSEPNVFPRRDFLKLVGLGVAGAAAGCAKPPADTLLPYLVAPESVLPGVAYWYRSTCRECPAGCGVMIKAREGRAIKIEGDPGSPVSRGGLCARGQAALQGLYDPDRIASPMVREGSAWKSVSWDEALALVSSKLAAATGPVVALTGFESGSQRALASEFASQFGGRHVMWEPFGHEAVRAACRRTFGIDAVPEYDLGSARFVISFGTDFLETFAEPTAQARGFAAMRSKRDDGFGHFVSVEPRLSLTGANADEWVAVRPGGEMAMALAMAHVILAEGLGPAADRGALAAAVSAFSPAAVAEQTDVPAETIQRLARMFAKQSPSLAIAGGVASQGSQATALAAAVNLLNHAAGNVGRTLKFDRALDLSALASFADLGSLVAAMESGSVGALVVHGANPVHATPGWLGAEAAMAKVPFKVALATSLDETAALCDVVLPVSHSIESFGDANHVRGVWSLQQAAMRPLPMFDARPAGDALIAIAKAAGKGGAWADTYHDYLKARWQSMHARFGAGRDFETFWNQSLEQGGVHETASAVPVRWLGAPAFEAPTRTGEGDLALVITPSNNFYDGRGANKGWLQELPDMTSKTVWGSWVEIHPETAKAIGVGHGDPVKVDTAAGSVEAPAYLYAGIRRDAVSIALGQGHKGYGRYAKDRGVNAFTLVPQVTDAGSGALAFQSANARIARGAAAMPLYLQQAEKNQHGRAIAQIIPVAALMAGSAGAHGGDHAAPDAHGSGGVNGGDKAERGYPGHYPAGEGVHDAHPSQTRPGKYTEPMARPEDYREPAHAMSAYVGKHQVRSPRRNPIDQGSYQHAKHRWAMAIDLNTCTGCGACVVACHAENNIPVVGPELVKRGREMSWIRIDRFEEKVEPGASDVRFVPMMCQHCSDAPCEMVCPVYATYHNPEGLNAQVYNRCVGTRYCSKNCPYKVRSFNFFDYSAPEKTTFAFPEPLHWQLNPDVTVRSKGVMEKCTMCIQRILDGKGTAKDEGRDVRDGEIQTACSQSCPTQAITFGDLADPESAVHVKSFGERKYWVFEELNTKPGVTYLQRIQRSTLGEAHA